MCAKTKRSGQKSLCEGARSSRNPGSSARGDRHQFATPRTSNQIHECAAPEPHDNVSAENTPTSKRDEHDTRHKETNETIPSDATGCCASSKTAASNLRRLPFLGRRTRVAQHGLLPVQRCPHELSPRPFPCHGQVTSKSTVALETNLVPLHGFPPPCRSRRHKALPPSHFASSTSLAGEVLLMFIPSLPSCTYFRHSDRSLLVNSRHSVGGTRQLDGACGAPVSKLLGSQHNVVRHFCSLRARHVFKVYARSSKNPRTGHPGKVFVTAGLQGWTPFQACERIRLLGSLQTNAGPCTFCRCDPVVNDSRQLH